MADLRQGRIVRVELIDPQGRNPKVRPAVIVTPTDQIQPDGEVQVIAITGETTAAPAEDCVSLPWLGTGHSKTGLTKPSVAVVTWQARVPATAILAAKGIVPSTQLAEILRKLAVLPLPPAPPPPDAS